MNDPTIIPVSQSVPPRLIASENWSYRSGLLRAAVILWERSAEAIALGQKVPTIAEFVAAIEREANAGAGFFSSHHGGSPPNTPNQAVPAPASSGLIAAARAIVESGNCMYPRCESCKLRIDDLANELRDMDRAGAGDAHREGEVMP